MQNNTSLNNMTHTYRECNIDYGAFSACQCNFVYKTLVTVRLYTLIIASICSFIGNLLVILTVYRNKNLRTSTNYFIVSMSVSDILFPLFLLLNDDKFLINIGSRLVVNLLCKLLPFVMEVSYGVSMLTLVVIALYRFSAVMFPLRARVQNKRKRLLLLLLTWVIPMAMNSPWLVYSEFNAQYQVCSFKLNNKQRRIWNVAHVSLFFFLPLLIMLVLYPLIIKKLKQHRVPGNVITLQTEIRRKRQNFRVTMMFIVVTVAFLLCWGPFIIFGVLALISYNIHRCISYYWFFVNEITTVVFHAINPVIYFIFLSSFRQGFKNIFRSSCCSRTRPQAPADNFELNNIPQGLHNNYSLSNRLI